MKKMKLKTPSLSSTDTSSNVAFNNAFDKFFNIQRNNNRLVDETQFYCDLFRMKAAINDEIVKEFNISMTVKDEDHLCFSLEKDLYKCVLSIPINNRYVNCFDQFLTGNGSFWNFFRNIAKTDGISIDASFDIEQTYASMTSWDRYVTQLGFDDQEILPFNDAEIKNKIQSDNIVWYVGPSCSGKTFMGIRELKSMPHKVAYNPCFSTEYEYDFIKYLICYGEDVALLLDDLQCDTEKTKELFTLILNYKNTFKKRDLSIFLISWVSLLSDDTFSHYKNTFNNINSNSDTYISVLRNRISDQKLKDICGTNLALLNIACNLTTEQINKNPEKALFSSFVKTTNTDKLYTIYRLCVLGTYEFLVDKNISGIVITPEDLSTIKEVNNRKYYIGHKEICRFVSTYISNHKKELKIKKLPAQSTIIYEHITSIESSRRWHAIKQLTGEKGEDALQNISPIWKGLHCFEQAISSQTKKDPTWGNTPSSMYFVLKVASLLGTLSEYKKVLQVFIDKFSVSDNKINVKYDQITTTNDFRLIKNKMIDEDRLFPPVSYESGNSIDCERAHKNWLLGLIVGLKNELHQYDHDDVFNAAINELMSEQDSTGYWYPKRVPWISARILIGLSQAGYTASNDMIRNGIKYLFECVSGNHWNAHTGGWNSPYETSSLCLEAIYNSKITLENKQREKIEEVIQFLKDSKEKWMSEDEDKIVDGTATACCLLKNYDHSQEFIDYIQMLCDKRVYSIVAKNPELNLTERQSCETTQIAWYVMDFCWDVLAMQLPDILSKFVSRSLQQPSITGGGSLMEKKKIFISYSEDSKQQVARIQKISSFLRDKGYTVWCYADEPLGTNIVSFMQNAPKADLILVLGSKKYKDKSLKQNEYKNKGSGVFFEDLVLSQMFIYDNSDKIIPIAFERSTSFDEAFPPPFSTNKGIYCPMVSESFLDNLYKSIEKKLGGK